MKKLEKYYILTFLIIFPILYFNYIINIQKLPVTKESVNDFALIYILAGITTFSIIKAKNKIRR